MSINSNLKDLFLTEDSALSPAPSYRALTSFALLLISTCWGCLIDFANQSLEFSSTIRHHYIVCKQ